MVDYIGTNLCFFIMISPIVDYTQRNPFTSFALVMLGVLVYQSLHLFWGFELLDSGFHLTAYDNIFDAPRSISYNFMYYLTNVIGGFIMYLFPYIGVLGFRVVGALFVDLSLFLIFYVLHKEVPVIHLLIGSFLVVVSYLWPYSFNNGILSCFFYVCFSLLLYNGLILRNGLLVLLSGIFVGINFFSRIPNVLSIGLVLLILFHSKIVTGETKYDWKSVGYFFIGIIVGFSILLLLILSLGHLSVFIEALEILLMKGTSSADGHTFWKLIWTQIYFYLTAIVFVAVFFSISYLNGKNLKLNIYRMLFLGLASFVVFYHVYLDLYLGSGYEPLWALCVLGCIVCVKKKGSLALLASLALYMLFVEILGSGSGNNHGSLPALLAAPVASYAILNKKNVIFVVVACIALFMKVIKQGTYFDFGPLSMKQSHISMKECSFIRTTQERAEVINISLPILKQYVHPKDTLLVYNAAPMINYLTHTRPAGGNCWPALGSLKPFDSPPMILIHRFRDFTAPKIQTYSVPTGNPVVDSYMQEHQYRIVWENPYFLLLFPRK